MRRSGARRPAPGEPVAQDSDAASAASELSFRGRGGGGGASSSSSGTAADEFLLIVVREARNLVPKDAHHDSTASRYPFARVTLGGASRKTRAISGTTHPLWEQGQLFALEGVPEEEPLLVQLFDRDSLRAKEFLGQVIMTLGKALEIATSSGCGEAYWFGLSRRHPGDVVSGELCLGFRLVDAVTYVQLVAELEGQADQEAIAARLAGKALHIPIWDVPAASAAAPGAHAEPGGAPRPPGASGPATGASTPEAQASGAGGGGDAPAAAARLLDRAGLAAALIGRQGSGSTADSAAGTPRSTPSTPRGAMPPPGGPPGSPPAPGGAGVNMRRAKSDAAGLLAPGRAAGGARSLLLQEGSLCAVTATRAPSAGAAQRGRKVHGLTELNDTFKARAFRSMLPAPREASRMGWAPTRAAPDGAEPAAAGLRLYCRTLEACVPLHTQLELALALGVVPQPAAAAAPGGAELAGGGGGGAAALSALGSDDTDDEGEAEGDAGACDEAAAGGAALTLPAPFDQVLLETQLEVGVAALQALLLDAGSPLMAAHWAAEGLRDVVVGPWAPGGVPGVLSARSVSYVKRLSIPFAPKQCQVWEEHQVLARCGGGFVVQHVCTNDAPKGDCFRALVQLACSATAPDACRLRVSMKLDWHRSTLGKALVVAGAEADARRSWARLVTVLRQHVATGGSAPGVGAAADDPAALQQQPEQQLQDAPPARISFGGARISFGGARAGSMPGARHAAAAASAPALLVAAVAALALLLLALAVWMGARSISAELHELNSALRALNGTARAERLLVARTGEL
ncbi:hypothetical protein HT031_003957 [Scenedesmus sp. PABB004]|nr:hypothetical protein HT031_003957 [Scenedesmus sp. PABB004]